MLNVALMVDRNGTLTTASLDVSSGEGWQGLDTVGNASLVPGSSVTVVQQGSSIYMALMVDSNGVLNVCSLNVGDRNGWTGPDTVGNATLVPGSAVTVFQQSTSVYTALMVDRYGVLNTASLDVSDGKGWQGMDILGNAILVPGSVVTVCHSASTFTALMVDCSGVLNVATLDVSSGGGWQGPVSIGNANLVPGSRVSVPSQ